MTSWEYNYSECKAETQVLGPGTYKFEVWGASGGNLNALGGAGGYASGIIRINKNTKIFVHVGSQGKDNSYGIDSAGCNGGGYATHSQGTSGGGATDIRIGSDYLYSRVIVAGGGGGTGNSMTEYGGFGGGEKGGDGANTIIRAGKGANQYEETTKCADNSTTSCPDGIFGFGGNTTGIYAGGAGGGWYGGSASVENEGGGGGSGYVFTSSSPLVSGFELGSEYYLEDAVLIDGNNSFPSPDKSKNETGHRGNGYAIISRVEILEIPSILDFCFYSSIYKEYVSDKGGVFEFNKKDKCTATIKPGKYQFVVNGSLCGQFIIADLYIARPQKIVVITENDSLVYLDSELIFRAPGSTSSGPVFIHEKAKVIVNYSSSLYHCDKKEISTVTIRYSSSLCINTNNPKISNNYRLINII